MEIIQLPGHLVDLNEHIFDSFKEDYFNFVQWFEKKVRNDSNRVCLVALNDSGQYAAVAVVKLEEFESSYDLGMNVAKLCSFKVLEPGLGYGTALMAAVRKVVPTQRTLYVEVLPKYDSLIKFFVNNGFVIVHEASTFRGEVVLGTLL